jgi:nitrite reductase/ring-hydroxylating ferredoxin subunit
MLRLNTCAWVKDSGPEHVRRRDHEGEEGFFSSKYDQVFAIHVARCCHECLEALINGYVFNEHKYLQNRIRLKP